MRAKGEGVTEDEVVGWHHRLNGYEFEQTPGDDKGQGSLQSMGSQRVRHDLVTEQHLKSINGNHHINKLKNWTPHGRIIDAEKVFHKILHLL